MAQMKTLPTLGAPKTLSSTTLATNSVFSARMVSASVSSGNVMAQMTVGIIQMKLTVKTKQKPPTALGTTSSSATTDTASPTGGNVMRRMIAGIGRMRRCVEAQLLFP
ncbi:hypothetical protein JRQ81_010731 [Phrynocephalus forsythii]|uniref:Uncharacterized protein n=1 Tax=Phrynocephalus forsythii TaxID=171643 RepID=A0A9Q0X7G7_9SAUR|nr:hypothetical protein JRQ81_010731 [Phrynocephalus forsythii]